jgi:predicted nucleotidyltransferase
LLYERSGGREVTEVPLVEQLLSPDEAWAVRRFVGRILEEVPATLVQAALFGSRSRGDGRPDSDLDVLLVFRWLPPDREPQAGHAERIAEEVAAESGVPVTVWSVALVDLIEGNRTPMLVDALADSRPIWSWAEPIPALPFTPPDAARCVRALLERVAEGSEEFAARLDQRNWREAARRGRDDIVRLCTALLLLHGVTRPRRAEAVHAGWRLARAGAAVEGLKPILRWACDSFGPSGRDDERDVSPPPGGFSALARAVDRLRALVAATLGHLEDGAGTNPPLPG